MKPPKNPCTSCGETHDPEDCTHGFNEWNPNGGSCEPYEIEEEKQMLYGEEL
jgi:hypothetical protein